MNLSVWTLDQTRTEIKITSNELSKRSKLHVAARKLLKNNFPRATIMEEVYMPVFDKKKLPFDFFIPEFSLVIEVHGEQHFKYTPHFHGSKMNYAKSLVRDSNKQEFCELNDINIVFFNFNESETEWLQKLKNDKLE